MEELLKTIPYMDEDELMQVIQKTVRAWGVIKPGTELVYVSLPLNEPGERAKILERTTELLLAQ